MIYTIKQFIKNGVHLGHYKWECDYRLSYFLLGMRNSIHIINLYYTLFVLKQSLYITYNMCMLSQKILIANNLGYKIESTFDKIDNKQLWYINNKWVGGLLSNQKGILLNNEKLFLKFYGIGYSALLPSYVFASNTQETSSCIFEAIILNIPSSALMDSNMGYYGIFYGIPSNDDNFGSVYLFTKLFIKTYLKSVYDSINKLKIEKGFEKINNYNNQPGLKLKLFSSKVKFLNFKARFSQENWVKDLLKMLAKDENSRFNNYGSLQKNTRKKKRKKRTNWYEDIA